jgi:hypothetical protein
MGTGGQRLVHKAELIVAYYYFVFTLEKEIFEIQSYLAPPSMALKNEPIQH